MENSTITTVIAIVLVALAIHFIRKLFKYPKVGSVCMVTGGVKTGKSTFSVALVLREWKVRHRDWKFRKFFQKLFKLPVDEEPLIYSNVPLSVPYVPLTRELLTRKKRFNYKSVIYICEASLVADSQMVKDKELNEQLLLFYKLIGHETKGGVLVVDSQCISDVHYSCKRVLSEYFYIHHLVKWIPFFLVAYIREERYSDDGTVVNVNDKDVEETLTRVIIPKSTWKKFDCYCYSALTDDKPVVNTTVVADSLKAEEIVSFKEDRLK